MAAILAGLALGGANSLSSALGSPYHPLSLAPQEGVPGLQYLAAWLGAGWAWALFAFAVGWFSRRLRSAILRAAVGLWAAVLAYYLSDALLAVNDVLSVGEIVLWSAIAAVAGPAMGTVGWSARRPNPWSLVAGMAAPGLMVVDTLWAPTGPDSARPWLEWSVYAGAGFLALALAARALVRWRETQ